MISWRAARTSLDVLLLGVLVVGEDLGLDDALVLPHQHLLNQAVGAELVLQLLGGDVLAVFGDDEILLAAGEVDKALLVHVAQVAGLQPAVLQGVAAVSSGIL